VENATFDEAALLRRVEEAGQGHVLRFWDSLSREGRGRLLCDLAGVDWDELARLVEEHLVHRRPHELPPDLEPAPFIPLPRSEAEAADRRRAAERGEALLAAGQVAAVVVAGGQGTRLGYDGPKGCFPIGPVSGHPFFRLFAESLLAARRACGAAIPWYIMTSDANDRATQDFFEAHNYFDLPRADVRIFRQGMMPAVDFQGKLLLAERDRLALSPDGHGGSLRALARAGMLADMARRGIEFISYFQVDNVLVPPIDPVFLGYHAARRCEMSAKMARKRDPKEKIGAFAVSRGRLRVIEYIDLPDDLATARDPRTRELRFDAGSIAIHILGRRFVERLTADGRFALPFHRAEKKIPCVDGNGRPVNPAESNGVKFETFVFDALPLAERTTVLEIDRAEEFSPVKNADREDSPATARRDMVRRAAAWLEQAGVEVPRGPGGEPLHAVEISPLAARTLDNLRDLVRRRGLKRVTADLYLGPDDA